jgi:RNA polymerase sigma-70 factor, ECF subfamily
VAVTAKVTTTEMKTLALRRGFELADDKRGSAEDFTALFQKHQGLVSSVIFQIAGPSLLSDLVQDAFIKIWKGLPDFREDAKLTSWIYRVATNVAIDSLRTGARKYESSEHDLGSFVDERYDGERDAANRQLVERGLAGLSADHRAVVVLALMHERSIAEVAEILGVSEGTVKSRLHYGKEHFRKILEGVRT